MIARIQQSMKEKDKGFTLIELLVVIIIIGILAAIAIPVFLNQRERAVDTSVRSDLRTIATELETYYVDNQEYPADQTVTGGPFEITGGTGADVDVAISDDNTEIAYEDNGDGTYTIVGTNPNGN